MGNKKSSDDRTRNWTFIVYPESAPENWEQLLVNQQVPWFCSPLHDADLNADETEKKAHWHCVLAFEGNKSFEQVKEIIEPLHCTIPQKVKNMKSMLRYFIHMDNPDKHQYKKEDIRCFGGADIESYFAATRSDRYAEINKMRRFIVDNDIIEFSDLFNYAGETDDPEHADWFGLLCDNSAYVIEMFIRSRRHQKTFQKEGEE